MGEGEERGRVKIGIIFFSRKKWQNINLGNGRSTFWFLFMFLKANLVYL
jgi:hypothetical protein